MRKLIAALVVALPLGAVGAGAAVADVSTTQHLPAQACNNSGTPNAHESVPETTGNGSPIHAHEAIPGTENVSPCGHGG